MEITADDSDDEAVALSYLESVGVVFVTPVAVHEKLDTLMGQLADMADKLVQACGGGEHGGGHVHGGHGAVQGQGDAGGG